MILFVMDVYSLVLTLLKEMFVVIVTGILWQKDNTVECKYA